MENIRYQNISSDVRDDKIKDIIEVVRLDKDYNEIPNISLNIGSDVYFAKSQKVKRVEFKLESNLVLDLEKDKVLIKESSLNKILLSGNSPKELENKNLTLLYSKNKDIAGGLLSEEYIPETKFIFFRSTCHFYSGHYRADNIDPFYKYYDSFNSFYGLRYSKFEIRKADYLELGKENDFKDMSLWIAGHKERLIVTSDSREIMDFFKVNLAEELIYKKIIGVYREKDMHMLGIIPIDS